jgi:hypothetical protein
VANNTPPLIDLRVTVDRGDVPAFRATVLVGKSRFRGCEQHLNWQLLVLTLICQWNNDGSGTELISFVVLNNDGGVNVGLASTSDRAEVNPHDVAANDFDRHLQDSVQRANASSGVTVGGFSEAM